MFFLSHQKEPKNDPQTGGLTTLCGPLWGLHRVVIKTLDAVNFDSVDVSNRITTKLLNLTPT